MWFLIECLGCKTGFPGIDDLARLRQVFLETHMCIGVLLSHSGFQTEKVSKMGFSTTASVEMSVRHHVSFIMKLTVWLQGSTLGKRCKREVTNYPNAT